MVEINNKTKAKIGLPIVKKTAEKFLKFYKKANKEVSIVFVGDSTIRRLNKIYRGKNKITDILSFEGEDDFLGEIIIDYSQIKRQAKILGNSIKNELIFILVHGLLHLVGYNDDTERGRLNMIRKGEKFIKNFKL